MSLGAEGKKLILLELKFGNVIGVQSGHGRVRTRSVTLAWRQMLIVEVGLCRSPWLVLIVAVFVSCLINANIIAVKLVNIFGLILLTSLAISLPSIFLAKRKMVETPEGVYPMSVNRVEPSFRRAPGLLSTIARIVAKEIDPVNLDSAGE